MLSPIRSFARIRTHKAPARTVYRPLPRLKETNTVRLYTATQSLSRAHPTVPPPSSSVFGRRAECLQLLEKNPELSSDEARVEYGWIVAHLRDNLKLTKATESPGVEYGTLRVYCKRRGSGEPLQYILGNVDFGPLTLLTRPPVFIPRPETAHVVERLVGRIRACQSEGVTPTLKILDICTGSGSLALLLAHYLRSNAHITGIDINPEAVTLARDNASFNDLAPYVEFQQQDVFGLRDVHDYDMVVSNPPYIPRTEWDGLAKSVKQYEDARALIGDPEDLPMAQGNAAVKRYGDGLGLEFYRKIATLIPQLDSARQSRSIPHRLPLVAVEIGPTQANDVSEIFKLQSGDAITTTEVWQDQFGKDRMVVAFGK